MRRHIDRGDDILGQHTIQRLAHEHPFVAVDGRQGIEHELAGALDGKRVWIVIVQAGEIE